MLSRIFSLFMLLALTLPTCAEAQSRPANRKAPPNRLPDLKTPEDKMRFLEMIRNSFPVLRIGRSVNYRSNDLDEQLEKY
ncbi:MAG: hypothetical protein HON04_08400, partial [Planctomicrobium sp.]|nr:hypothetical protein [Planctomicrobium sp.]